MKITNVEQKYYVDEQGLYSDLHVDIVVQPKSKIEFVNLDFVILPTSGSKEIFE